MCKTWNIILTLLGQLTVGSSQFLDPFVVLDAGGPVPDIKYSTSQLSVSSTASFIYVPGDPELDLTAASNFTDRNACGNYAFQASVPDPEGSPLDVVLTIMSTKEAEPDDKPECDINWGDGVIDEGEKMGSGDSEMEVEHTYMDFGIYPIVITCEADDGIEQCPPSDIAECVQTTDFLDNVNLAFKTPLTFFTSDKIQIKSYMQFLDVGCGTPVINWRIVQVNVSELINITHFPPSHTSVLNIDQGLLEPGEYVVTLEISFPEKSSKHYIDDSLVMKIVLPELVTHIYGGEYLTVPYGGDVFIDATISTDPAEGLASLEDVALNASWTFLYYPQPLIADAFMALFPAFPIPPLYTSYQIQTGTEYALKIGSTNFTDEMSAIVMFTLTRGDRASTAMQVIRFRTNALPLSIQCVYNCHVGRERLFYHDKLDLNTKFASPLDTSEFTFKWTIDFGIGGLYLPYFPIVQTGYTSSALGITSKLDQGFDIKISVQVSAPGYANSNAKLMRKVNHIPYMGTCALLSTVAIAARDWVELTCSGWLGNDDRKNIDLLADVNPILTYTVRQRTETALVEEEPILNTRSKKSHIVLKVGDPDNAYATTIIIRIADMFGNYATIELPIVSTPPFDTTAVTPNIAGSDLVASYTEVDYPFDEQQLRDMGKSDMIISLVSAVCSIIHLIELPIWEPPVPRVLNDDGAVLDLKAGGNAEVGDFEEVSTKADNETTDPATLTIQSVTQKMTTLLKDVVQVTIIEGTRRGDTVFTSFIMNGFNNLAAKSQFVNFDTKVDLIYLAKVVGIEALTEQNTTRDRSAEIETAAGELYFMFQSIVNSVVPDDLLQIRPVPDFKNSRVQLGDMLTVIGQNISTNDTLLSPAERAYFYMQMQNKLRYQTDGKKAAARNASTMARALAREVQGKLRICSTCSNENTTSTNQLVKKNKGSKTGFDLSKTKTSRFRIDGLSNALNERRMKRSADGLASDIEDVDVSAFEFEENVFMYDNDGTSSFITSNVLRVDVKAGDDQINPGYMTFEQNVQTPETETITPIVDEEDASEFMYHQFVYQKNTDQVCVIIVPLGENHAITEYEIYIRFTEPPSLIDFDFIFNVNEDEAWLTCVKSNNMQGHTGLTYMGVHLPNEKKSVNYNMTLITVNCLAWDENEEKWHTDRCSMKWIPEYNKISCYCNDITDMVFSNSFFVAPNSIDFSSVFLKFSPLNQAAVMSTLIGIFLIFIICVIFLVGLDRKDTLKWGITPLRDNYICDKHYYLIKVLTGMRRGAGTRSRVAFILSGDLTDTGPRELFDGVREEFSTGSCLTFFMATGKHLGNLEHLSIWHDNSGEEDDASWYLNQVVVYDVTQREIYTFVAEQWLSVETGLELSLKSNPKNDPIKFESRFFYQTRDRLSESHMWVSIMYRPQTSTFTRVQRAACALVYVMLNMIANAMYFNPSPNYQSPPLLQVGPFRFTQQQIFISLVCALMTTPPVMLLILLFKRTKRRPVTTEKSCCSCCSKAPCVPFCKSLFRSRKGDYEKRQEELLRSKLLTPNVPDFSGAFYLPHWFVYITWFIVFGAVITSAFFIMLYSIEWGKQKSEEWLTAFFMSLFESMLFVDPITVVCIAFVLACIIRSNKEDTNLDMVNVVRNYRRIIGEDEDTVSSSIKVLKSIKTDYTSYKSIPRNVTPPLRGDNLAQAAEQHRMQEEMTSVLRDIIINIFFMIIVSGICFANRDDRSYQHREQIVNTIVSPSSSPNFIGITRAADLFAWLDDTVFPSLFPVSDYEGTTFHWSEKEYTEGIHDYRLGPPRLRQVRTTKDLCKIPYIGTVDCYSEYSITDEDITSYCIGWKKKPCKESEGFFNASHTAWAFTSAVDIWGIPLPGMYKTYGGGGYMATFDISLQLSRNILKELFNSLWIDRQTRAVMFEYTLYNPATNLFIYNLFMVEFPETGGTVTAYSIYPVRLYTHHGGSGTFTLFCEVIFAVLLVVLIVKICIRLYQQRCGYFKQFWQVYELFMFLIGGTAIGIFFIRLGFTNITISRFMEDKKQFVNFNHIVLWDQILISLLSLILFMSTIQILQALGTTKKISAIIKIFKNCGIDLFWYGTAFLHIFFGFCMLGMLLFGSQLISYMSMYQTMGTLFIAMIGKSKFTDIAETQPIFAKIFFVFYILTVVFFVLTIFLSILGSSIDQVMHDTRADKRVDLVEFMMKQLKSFFVKPSNNVDSSQPDTKMSPLQKSLLEYHEDETLEKFRNIDTGPTHVLELPKHPPSTILGKKNRSGRSRKTVFVSE